MTYRDDREALRALVDELTKERDALRADLMSTKADLREATADTLEAQRDARDERVRSMGRRALGATKMVGAGAFGLSLAVGLVVACVRSCESELPSDAHGVVTDRYHHAAYTSVTCSGRPAHCVSTYHPESWSVRVAHDGHERVDSVTESEWSQIEEGDRR